MQRKSKYKLEDFLQTLSNGHQVFKFKNFEKTPFGLVLIISERGSKGKTLNAKEYARELWLENKKPSIWINNTIPQIEKTCDDFYKDLNKPFVRNELGKDVIDFWNRTKITGDAEKNLARVVDEKQEFIKLLAPAHFELMKGSRVPWGAIFWDEFNVKFEAIRNPIEKFDSLLHSLEDVVAGNEQNIRLFLFGNNKSIDNELIYNLGLTHIEHEITELWSDDETPRPLMLVVAPQFTQMERQEIEEKNKNNFIFNLSRQMGTANHAYFNESLNDDLNHIVRYQKEGFKNLIPQFSVYHDTEYYNVYRVAKTGYMHIIAVKKEETFPSGVYIFNKRDAVENVELNSLLGRELFKYASAGNVSYQDVRSRILFLHSIK